MSETATLKRPSSEIYNDNDVYRLPIIAELAERVDIVREADVPPLTIERRWADLHSPAGVEHYNLRPDLAPGNSFKPRGAYTAVRRAVLEQGASRIGTASAGNHAQGIANAVKKFAERGHDVTAKIWIPANTPGSKIDGIASFNSVTNDLIHIDMTSPTFNMADDLARTDENFYYISPFDNYDVIAGQGTVATEALAAHPNANKLFVTVGGGGLLAGALESVASMKQAGLANPDLKVVAVMLKGNDSLLQTLQRGRPSQATQLDTLAEGAAVAQIGDIPAQLIQRYKEHLELLTITRDDLAETHQHLKNRSHQYPPDEMTSLLPQAGAAVLAKLRNRYDTPEIWLTMSTGTNTSHEKTVELEQHYQQRRSERTAMLRAMARPSVAKLVTRPTSNKRAASRPRLGVASGYVIR